MVDFFLGIVNGKEPNSAILGHPLLQTKIIRTNGTKVANTRSGLATLHALDLDLFYNF